MVGSRGGAVWRLQSNLIGWPCLTGSADSIDGKRTEATVPTAQRVKRLPATGIADVRLSLVLLNGPGD